MNGLEIAVPDGHTNEEGNFYRASFALELVDSNSDQTQAISINFSCPDMYFEYCE
jgi:hypothetical protein